jgi:hypothetical protein
MRRFRRTSASAEPRCPPLNNLRMFANVPQCFLAITDLINALFHEGKVDPKLREYMYLRIAAKCGLLYEDRHNLLFAEQLGMTDAEVAAVSRTGRSRGSTKIAISLVRRPRRLPLIFPSPTRC